MGFNLLGAAKYTDFLQKEEYEKDWTQENTTDVLPALELMNLGTPNHKSYLEYMK